MDKCPICGGDAERITRGVPSYAFCINNHQWDRAKNIVYKKTYKELEQENQKLREIIETCILEIDYCYKMTGSYLAFSPNDIEDMIKKALPEIRGE